MHVVLAFHSWHPAMKYGATDRVVWALGRGLAELGHRVTFLAARAEQCSFAKIVAADSSVGSDVDPFVPADADLVHFHDHHPHRTRRPHLYTCHTESHPYPECHRDTVFVSRAHAQSFGSECYVHNGLHWDSMPPFSLARPRAHFHFLGNAAFRRKNVRGAIRLARKSGQRLQVLGGRRFNLRMGARFTLDPCVRFAGQVDDRAKYAVMSRSRGLIFPVLWREPFGLAVIESLFCGCPVFATPYGALPEIVTHGTGVLSANAAELISAIGAAGRFDRETCRRHAVETFSARNMAENYVKKYAEIVRGRPLNPAPPRRPEPPPPKFLDFSW